MNNGKGQKFSVAVLILVTVSIFLYIIQGVYFDKTGKIETEFALRTTQKEVLSVDGYAVRDENRNSDGKNTSILYKKTDKVYVPVVSDSVNVAVNDVIAVCFNNESQADAYLEIQEYKEKKKALERLQSQENMSRVNVLYLNSQIYSTAQKYSQVLSDGELSSLPEVIDSFTKSMTSKQIATGKSIDYTALIESYNDKIKKLEAGIKATEYVRSPFAGYFVSQVDGFENNKSYDDVSEKKIEASEATELISSKASKVENAYGKIIGQHTWFLLFDVPLDTATIIKTGKQVIVDFPERSIYDIPMTVYDVTERKGDKITVTLKCKYLNEQLSVLRKENLSITIEEYEGFRISSSALTQNDEGIDGVYVLAGNVAKFTPVNILYYGGDYVVADEYIAYKKDKKGNMIIDEELTATYRKMKAYDRIIVKGKNITDGKVIG